MLFLVCLRGFFLGFSLVFSEILESKVPIRKGPYTGKKKFLRVGLQAILERSGGGTRERQK